MVRVLFIEPFYGGSHRSFADGLVAHSRHEIELLVLPEGEWRRRMRLGAQELAKSVEELPGPWDCLISTDMLDLPDFLALTRPRFASIPILHYFHENQFTYPRLRGTKLNSWFGQINYVSALAANRVAFNSQFHRDDFVGALTALTRTPTNWLDAGGIDRVGSKSAVLPVGLDLQRFDAVAPVPAPPGPPVILWNHRWEFDKSPELFVRTIAALAEEGLDFRVAVAGSPGDNPAAAMASLPSLLGDRLVHFGFAESPTDYARLLHSADIAVSTSRQEFFGIATIEAMYCGALPIVPSRLNYPALVPGNLHGRCLYESEFELRTLLRQALRGGGDVSPALKASAAAFDWTSVAPLWDSAIDDLVAG